MNPPMRSRERVRELTGRVPMEPRATDLPIAGVLASASSREAAPIGRGFRQLLLQCKQGAESDQGSRTESRPAETNNAPGASG